MCLEEDTVIGTTASIVDLIGGGNSGKGLGEGGDDFTAAVE